MALVVNETSYLTQIEATQYITDHYPSTDEKLIAWNLLSTGDKDAYLRKSAQTIDKQPLIGYKAVYAQPMAFPRRIRSYDPSLQQFIPEVVAPDAVKWAQVELALELMTGPNERAQLQREGVKSFSVGNLSESYGSGKSMALPYEVMQLLKPFLAGSVAIK